MYLDLIQCFHNYLQDPEYDLLSEKNSSPSNEKEIADFDITTALPINFKELDKEGLFWVAGFIAYEMRNVQDNLGHTIGKACEIPKVMVKLWSLPGFILE